MRICFDMDGTIANLYGVENWLEYLIAEDVFGSKLHVATLVEVALRNEVDKTQGNIEGGEGLHAGRCREMELFIAGEAKSQQVDVVVVVEIATRGP